jgi:hypothetical protein
VDAEVPSSLTADREAAIRALVLEMERELATPPTPRFV